MCAVLQCLMKVRNTFNHIHKRFLFLLFLLKNLLYRESHVYGALVTTRTLRINCELTLPAKELWEPWCQNKDCCPVCRLLKTPCQVLNTHSSQQPPLMQEIAHLEVWAAAIVLLHTRLLHFHHARQRPEARSTLKSVSSLELCVKSWHHTRCELATMRVWELMHQDTQVSFMLKLPCSKSGARLLKNGLSSFSY